MTSTSPLVAHGQPTEYFTFVSLSSLGVPHATTTKHCPGVSSFAEPIVPEAPKPPFRSEATAVLGATGLEMSRVSYARQVHGADVARVTAELARAFGDRWRTWVAPSRGGHVMLDLWSANEALLVEAGVAPESIENPRLCTACHPDLLYSYRRGNRGRLVTVAAVP